MAEPLLPRPRRRHERRQGDPRRAERRRRGVGDVAAARCRRRSPGWAEQDPEAWWQATLASIDAVLARSGATRASRRSASRGRCTRRCSSTRRATSFGRRCSGATGARPPSAARSRRASAARSGCAISRANPALEGFTLPKVLWLRNHEPEAFARLATVLLAKDYIRYRLTGALATEPSDASATLMYDTAQLRWSDGDPDARWSCRCRSLPDVGGSSEVLGRVTRGRRAAHRARARARRSSAAARTTRAARRASASIAPGEAVDELGDVGHGARADGASRSSIPACARTRSATSRPDMWYLMGVVLTAGGAFAWYRDQLARELAGAGDANARLNAEAATIPRRRRRRDVPAVSAGRAHAASRRGGARRVPRTRASRTRARISTRAVLEGICFALRDSRHDSAGARARRRASCCSPAAARRARSPAACRREVFGLPVTHGESRGGPGVRRGAARRGRRGRVPRSRAPRREATLTRGAARASRAAALTRRTRSRTRASATSYPRGASRSAVAWLTSTDGNRPPSSRTRMLVRATAARVAGDRARHRRRARHHRADRCSPARISIARTGVDGQQLLEREHAHADRHRRELLRDHGRSARRSSSSPAASISRSARSTRWPA